MPEKIRSFIALELPQEIKTFLASLEENLRQSRADVKWVNPENIHLTLKFLGERDKKQLDAAASILDEVAEQNFRFEIELSSLGAFPKIDFPRVIWVGVGSGDQQVCAIANALEEKIAKLGIPKEERPFSSHITIGRVRSPQNKQNLVQMLKESGGKIPGDKLKFTAEKITLFKSTLSSQGPIYEILHEAYLKKT